MSLWVENSPVEVDYLYLSVVLCAYEDLGKLFHICKGKADKKCATGVFAFSLKSNLRDHQGFSYS